MTKEKKKNKKLIIIIISIAVAVAAGLIIFFVTRSNDETDSSYEGYNYEKSEKKESKPKELTESEKMLVKLNDLIDEGLVYDTGDYIAGEIPKGEYAFIKLSGSSSYYEEDDAAGNIIDNENFDSFGYVKVHATGNLETRGVLVSINAFEKLGVKGAKEIYEILNDIQDYNQGGFYKVGTDIEPGKYILESMGSAYWAKLSGPVSSNDIIDNDNFNGKARVTLKNGQYLEISRATLTKEE